MPWFLLITAELAKIDCCEAEQSSAINSVEPELFGGAWGSPFLCLEFEVGGRSSFRSSTEFQSVSRKCGKKRSLDSQREFSAHPAPYRPPPQTGTPAKVHKTEAGAERDNESSTASGNVNSTLRRFDAIAARTLESKTSAMEQPGAEVKFPYQITRDASVKAGSRQSAIGTTARNAWPPFESYRVDACLRVEVIHG